MKTQTSLLVSLFILLSIVARGQDSLYAEKIERLWTDRSNVKHPLFIKKNVIVDKTSLQYTLCKDSRLIRSIISLNKSVHEFIIFFYVDNMLVMISPIGQQPYYILNDKVVDAREIKHTPEQMETLIKKANEYLAEVYKRINK